MHKSKKKQGPDAEGTSLRSYAKWRILNDMVDQCKRRSRYDRDYIILVMDCAALKVFSSCCKMFDVYKAGIYHIERLEKRRKKYPYTDAIYLIHPTRHSIQRLLDDFAPKIDAKGKPVDPQYGAAHLCFTSKVQDEYMQMLYNTNGNSFVPRVNSFMEVNLDFYFFNDNVFHLGRPDILPLFRMLQEGGTGGNMSQSRNASKNPTVDLIVNEMSNKLFTVCAIYNEHPYIQYQGESEICRMIADQVKENLLSFYKDPNIKVKEPRGSLLLVDRSFDLISPAAHDYFYQSNMANFKEGFQNDDGLFELDGKQIYLNDNDEIWCRFRNTHCVETFQQISEEANQIVQDNKAKRGKSAEDMSVAEMSKMLREGPKLEELMKNYKLHMDILNKLIKEITSQKIQKVVQLEQLIISGLQGIKNTRADNTDIVKQVSQISKELEPQDYLRLLMIYFTVFELSEKDKDTMLKSCGKESYKEIIHNMEYLDQSLGTGTKFKRALPEMTQEEYTVYMKNHSEAKFDILKCEAKLCRLLRQMHAGTLDSKLYPYIGNDKPKIRVTVGGQQPAKSRYADDSNTPRLFCFVMGGLSHHEIVQLDLLQKEMPAQIIPGSNEIISANDFIEQLSTLHKKESQENFKDRIQMSIAQIDVPGKKSDFDSTAEIDFGIN